MAIKGFTEKSGAADTKEMQDATIRALLEERRGYETHGNKHGVADVDAELARMGAEAQPKAKRAAKRVTKPAESRG